MTDLFTTPAGIDVEKALLGAWLIDNAQIDEAEVCPDDFKSQKAGVVCRAILKLHKAGHAADLATIAAALEKSGELESVGAVYLSRLLDAGALVMHAPDYAAIVREKALRRRIVQAGHRLMKMAAEDWDTQAVLDMASRELTELELKSHVRSACRMGELIESRVDEYEQIQETGLWAVGIPTGFPDLDQVALILGRSRVVTLAARPGMGKTSFALNIAVNAAAAGHAVVFFSLEMSRADLVDRILAAATGIEARMLTGGRMGGDEWSKVVAAAGRLSELPLFIDDDPALHISEISRRARKQKREKGLSLVILDYIQLATGEQGQGREREIASISAGLVRLAKELEIPVLSIAQLNRGVELRTDKVPKLADLRESGALEQDSDLVMFLYRPDYYDDDETKKNLAEIHIEKNRFGPTGYVQLLWDPIRTSFKNKFRENQK